ncbi:MAG: hypothetical protein HGA74_15085, partial [Deltaproteobacteria bacterium]|nr:hypothetical protein [Deltaproteobacteria bacterium]
MTIQQEPANFKWIEPCRLLLLVFLLFARPVSAASFSEYVAVPGLMDLRTTFSDGIHSPEDLVTIARLRGFRVLFFNDHHTIKLSYGIRPFRNLLKYSKEYPSIMTHGPQAYLDEIARLSKLYPDMILVPGAILSPFYYWSGSWFSGDLTVHNYDRKILAFNLTKAEHYERLPKFTPYEGDLGIAPFQEMINAIHERGGFAFWNYPEQRSGVRKHGPVNVSTMPYPEVIQESKNYAGFAAIYGDRITVTDPGKRWDRTLTEYCEGKREKPVWGISTADFHEDGRLGLKLGAFPTTFLVREFSKTAILDALRQGRMYCSRGDGKSWPQLDRFDVLGPEGHKAHMGETLTTAGFPLIRFRVSYRGDEKVPMTIHLIRGGTLLRTVDGETPLEFELLDQGAPPGQMTYYRLVDSVKHLTSNPIFVKR